MLIGDWNLSFVSKSPNYFREFLFKKSQKFILSLKIFMISPQKTSSGKQLALYLLI